MIEGHVVDGTGLLRKVENNLQHGRGVQLDWMQGRGEVVDSDEAGIHARIHRSLENIFEDGIDPQASNAQSFFLQDKYTRNNFWDNCSIPRKTWRHSVSTTILCHSASTAWFPDSASLPLIRRSPWQSRIYTVCRAVAPTILHNRGTATPATPRCGE